MAHGQVSCQKQDADSDPVGRFNQIPTLVRYLCEEEIPSGEITELAANIMKEQLYNQCDFNGNNYLLL